ncbi:unnamed protein product, partial [Meganyctiphanes norvegica]
VLLVSLTFLGGLTISLFPMVPSAVDHQNISNSTMSGNGTLLATDTNNNKYIDGIYYTKDRNDPIQLIPSEDHIKDRNATSKLVSTEKNTPNYALTFWTYFIAKALFGLITSPAITIYDGAVLSHMQERGVDYGKQRAWGYIANALAPPLGGYMVDCITPGNF